jgi:hypothetical protein
VGVVVPPLPVEVAVPPQRRCRKGNVSPPLGERGYVPPLWLCDCCGHRWRQELICKVRCCIHLIEDGNIDWSKGIFVPPGATATSATQDVAEHGLFDTRKEEEEERERLSSLLFSSGVVRV